MFGAGKFLFAAIRDDANIVDLAKRDHLTTTHFLHGLVFLRVKVVLDAREGLRVTKLSRSLRLFLGLLILPPIGLLEIKHSPLLLRLVLSTHFLILICVINAILAIDIRCKDISMRRPCRLDRNDHLPLIKTGIILT
jgi:hypothetical protein